VKTHRIWIEIVLLGTAIACAVALLFVTIGAAAGTALGQIESTPPTHIAPASTYEGMVTCSRCGAKHSANLARTASDCVRVCVHSGSQFALVEADASYLLDGNLNDLKRVAGQRVRITGNLSGKTIHVVSVVLS